jgi:hypothetical protein
MPGVRRWFFVNDRDMRVRAAHNAMHFSEHRPGCNRHPKIRRNAHVGAGEMRRSHADDRKAPPIQGERGADDARIAAQFFPEPMRQHRDWMTIRRTVFFREKRAAKRKWNFEKLKIVAADELRENVCRLATCGHAHGRKLVRCHASENRVLLGVIDKIQIRVRLLPVTRIHGVKLHQVIRVAEAAACSPR